jgi:hypothetical protein
MKEHESFSTNLTVDVLALCGLTRAVGRGSEAAKKMPRFSKTSLSIVTFKPPFFMPGSQ